MRIRATVFGSLILFSIVTPAIAAPYNYITDPNYIPPILYNVTPLGASYSFDTDSGGTIHHVTNSDASAIYDFNKSPVTMIYERINGGSHALSYTLYTMENNGHKVGYNYDYAGSLQGPTYAPTFAWISGGWSTSGQPPVTDINANGQVIGWSAYSDMVGGFPAFTTVDGMVHGFPSQVFDNLNNYILPIPNVTLTSAFKIDDDGRIMTEGSDSNYYLLSPIEPGQPQPVPEPTALMLFGLVAGVMATRRICRRAILSRAFGD